MLKSYKNRDLWRSLKVYCTFCKNLLFYDFYILVSVNQKCLLYKHVYMYNFQNITPSKIKSHLEVCLDEICTDKTSESDDTLNLTTMLNDLNQMARHLGDDLSMKIVPLVSMYLEEAKESEVSGSWINDWELMSQFSDSVQKRGKRGYREHDQ